MSKKGIAKQTQSPFTQIPTSFGIYPAVLYSIYFFNNARYLYFPDKRIEEIIRAAKKGKIRDKLLSIYFGRLFKGKNRSSIVRFVMKEALSFVNLIGSIKEYINVSKL